MDITPYTSYAARAEDKYTTGIWLQKPHTRCYASVIAVITHSKVDRNRPRGLMHVEEQRRGALTPSPTAVLSKRQRKKGTPYVKEHNTITNFIVTIHSCFPGVPRRLRNCTPLRTAAQLLLQATVQIKHEIYFNFFFFFCI